MSQFPSGPFVQVHSSRHGVAPALCARVLRSLARRRQRLAWCAGSAPCSAAVVSSAAFAALVAPLASCAPATASAQLSALPACLGMVCLFGFAPSAGCLSACRTAVGLGLPVLAFASFPLPPLFAPGSALAGSWVPFPAPPSAGLWACAFQWAPAAAPVPAPAFLS